MLFCCQDTKRGNCIRWASGLPPLDVQLHSHIAHEWHHLSKSEFPKSARLSTKTMRRTQHRTSNSS